MGLVDIQNYTFVADVCSIIFCTIFAILLESTFTIRRHSQILFRSANYGIIVAAFLSIGYHHLAMHVTEKEVFALYLLHMAYQMVLIVVFYVFCAYLCIIVNVEQQVVKRLHIWMGVTFLIFLLLESLSPVTKLGLYVTPDLEVRETLFFSPFQLAYATFIVLAFRIFSKYRRKLITRMLYCLVAVNSLSLLTIGAQLFFRQSSYTCITFTFPVVAILFLFHYNAYDMETGMLDNHTFSSYISQRTTPFSMICLYLEEVEVAKMLELSEEFYHFNERYFSGCATFRLKDHKLVMVYPQKKNPNAEETIRKVLHDFEKLYEKYLIEYKVVLMNSNPYMHTGEEYVALNEYVESHMELHEIKRCTEADLNAFLDEQYVVKHLRDIANKGDLDDPRVLVYCQPMLSIEENVFVSAESLMRLELPEKGMIYPDIFIPLAEKYDFIRPLSRIILHKTCKKILEIENDGYRLDRVSLNFSMTEVRNHHFVEDFKAIVQETEIPFEKLAIELTESKTEYDFEKVRQVMDDLKHLGITFYLDDFGTGYSNFERIMVLPFDIIKFDRSLLRMAGTSENAKYMVQHFSEMFVGSGFRISIEGVEDERDEALCRELKASYLQGYKYSKPIPLDRLMDYLEPGI